MIIIGIEKTTTVSVKMSALPSSLGTIQQVQQQLDSNSRMQIRSAAMLPIPEHYVTGFIIYFSFILLVYPLKTSVL
jgi:hypothetical protein